MIELKVKCTICGKEESNKEIVKEASDIVKKYGLKAEHYLSLLNLMSGKCMDSDEHSFVFDETFLKQAEELVTKHKNDILEVEKLKVTNVELKREADEVLIRVQELQSKFDFNKERINNLYNSVKTYEDELERSTGHNKIEIWY